MTTRRWKRDHGSRSRRAGMFVRMMLPAILLVPDAVAGS
jgi:hypothetical protein